MSATESPSLSDGAAQPLCSRKVSFMLDFPATHKNREVILEVLTDVFLPQETLEFLELASGSGQHAAYFAQSCPSWKIQPSDLESEHLLSIAQYTEHLKLSNVRPPLSLDAASPNWNLEGKYDGVWAINLIHISPWESTLGLFRGAADCLKEHGKIFLYGAYKRGGEHSSESNAAFDQSLRHSNPEWGVRCLDEVTKVAKDHGFELERVVEMKANNLSVVFEFQN